MNANTKIYKILYCNSLFLSYFFMLKKRMSIQERMDFMDKFRAFLKDNDISNAEAGKGIGVDTKRI